MYKFYLIFHISFHVNFNTNLPYIDQKSALTVSRPWSQLQQNRLHCPIPQQGVAALKPPQSLDTQLFLCQNWSTLPPGKSEQFACKLGFLLKKTSTLAQHSAFALHGRNDRSSIRNNDNLALHIVVCPVCFWIL